jgi:CPA1 family monovalent cation:H+ antiporter
LRGALTLVLALAVTENRGLDPQVQRFVAVLATGLVLFTLFVNGTT